MKHRRNPFPGVSTKPDRHGKLRHRLRRTVGRRKVDAYLPGPYGSPAFRAAFEEALEGVRLATRRAQPGTVGYLIEAYLASTAFRNLADRTRADKRWRQDWIKEAIGSARYASIQPRHMETLMSKKGGPAAANRLKKDLSLSCSDSPRSDSATKAKIPPRWRIRTRRGRRVFTPGQTTRSRYSVPSFRLERRHGWRLRFS